MNTTQTHTYTNLWIDMVRARSKSVVLQIANDVPALSNGVNTIHEETEKLTPTTFRKSRSKSVCINDDWSYVDEATEERAQTHAQKHSYTHTQTNVERKRADITLLDEEFTDQFWRDYLNSFNYDSVLKPDNIEYINDQHLDKVLGFQSNLRMNRAQLDQFITQTDQLLVNVDDLFDKYRKIISESLDFDNAANELIQRQTQYEKKFENIHRYLQHFEHLDSITKNLSRSGSHLLTQKRQFFINDILINLDSSLDFIEKHENFQDSELYKSRFRQCMTRALTLIRNYLNNELRSISDSVERSLQDPKKTVGIELLLYNEFNNYLKFNQEPFNELIVELVKRCINHREYNGLLNDILQFYFQIRKKFQKVYIDKTSTINELYKNPQNKQTNLVQACQDQISYFKKIIEKEHSLFIKFFAVTSFDEETKTFVWDEFYSYLKVVMDPLYDVIRLLVLKESNIGTLCELTTLLQKYYEFEEADNGSIDAQSYFSFGGAGSSGHSSDLIKYGVLFQPLLDDTLNRLIFRVQKYLDNDLKNYKPKPLDLKIGNRKQQTHTKDTKKNQLDIDFDENLLPDVYLPLAKALSILSSIYELVNSFVFDDLAHYIVHTSIELLRDEYLRLAIAHMGRDEGQLAYLKNLIILRNHIANFDIHFYRNDYTIDFTSGISDVWHSLRNRQFEGKSVTGAFFSLAKKTVPKVINNMMDANQEIEMELNNAVTTYITQCSTEICKPLHDEPKPTKESITEFKDNLIIKIPNYYNQIRNIIDDPVVTKFLMENLSNLVLVAYEHFFNSLPPDYQSEGVEDLMEVDALYGFINDIIQHLYDEDENQQKAQQFNEDILQGLGLEDNGSGVDTEVDFKIPKNNELSPIVDVDHGIGQNENLILAEPNDEESSTVEVNGKGVSLEAIDPLL